MWIKIWDMKNYIIVNGQKINIVKLWNKVQQLEHRVNLLEKENNIKKDNIVTRVMKLFKLKIWRKYGL